MLVLSAVKYYMAHWFQLVNKIPNLLILLVSSDMEKYDSIQPCGD